MSRRSLPIPLPLALPLAGLLAACAPGAVIAPDALATPPAGTYLLVTVAGQPVPHTPVVPGRPPDAPPLPMIVGATLVIVGDGTFRQHMTYRFPEGDGWRPAERDFTGTWTRDDDGFLLRWDGAGSTPASLQGEEFRYDSAGMVLAFRRER
jgi:hypothetical protein